MGKYFGTDGFRGEAGVNLTADHAYKVGRFLGWYYGMLRQRNGEATAPRIVIGKDTRRSSYMLSLIHICPFSRFSIQMDLSLIMFISLCIMLMLSLIHI